MTFIADTMTFKPERSSSDFSGIVTHTTAYASCAQTLNPSRAGTLYGRMRVFSSDSPATTARVKYWSRFHGAYGRCHSPAEPPRQSLETGVPDPSHRSTS